jgi:hypothetical protein
MVFAVNRASALRCASVSLAPELEFAGNPTPTGAPGPTILPTATLPEL